jgi:hypothetical protein
MIVDELEALLYRALGTENYDTEIDMILEAAKRERLVIEKSCQNCSGDDERDICKSCNESSLWGLKR